MLFFSKVTYIILVAMRITGQIRCLLQKIPSGNNKILFTTKRQFGEHVIL